MIGESYRSAPARLRRYATNLPLRPGLLSLSGLDDSPSEVVSPTLAPVGRRRRRVSGFAALVIAADLSALAVAWALIRINVPVLLMMGALGIGMFALAGYYRSRLTLSALDTFPGQLGRAVVAGTVATTIGDFMNQGASALNVIGTALLWAVVMTLARSLAYAQLRHRRASLTAFRPTVILGSGAIGTRLAGVLREHPEYGLHPIGFVDDDPLLGQPVLGGILDLAAVIARTGACDVIVAFSSVPDSKLVDILRGCDRLEGEIYLVPRLFELHQHSATCDYVWGIPMTRLPRMAFRSRMRVLKRGMDILLAALALIVLSPVLAMCAAGAAYETGGVLFRQERVGSGARTFNLLKFQTLRPASEEESAQLWNVGEDRRVGPVGRVLRRTSLDELPQLWNIVRGDMSFVGPRPERPYFAGQFAGAFPRYSARTRVTVGLTGWAQVHNLRGDTSIEDRVAFDNHYIEHWSLWGDVKILLRTVMSVLRAAGR
ncbi:exopolysaccharide biosynthesis polyprenyl glycosylphosphotransferase [soil metagenome]